MSRHSRYIDDPSLSAAENATRFRMHSETRFYRHLLTYTAVNAGLMALNLFLSPERLWFYWPLLGWGIGLTAHGLKVFMRHRYADRRAQ